MTDRLKDDIDDSALIERIRQAFSNAHYPGDNYLIGTPEHIAVCEECRELRKMFVRLSWSDLIDRNEIDFEITGVLSLLSTAGWQYYLLAYLILSVQEQSRNTIYFRPGIHLEERLKQLPMPQFEVLAAYILITLEAERESNLSFKNSEYRTKSN